MWIDIIYSIETLIGNKDIERKLFTWKTLTIKFRDIILTLVHCSPYHVAILQELFLSFWIRDHFWLKDYMIVDNIDLILDLDTLYFLVI